MDTIRLLARADDAGLNETANRAIRATAAQGIVRNISLMAPAPAIADAAEVLEGLDNRVDFGLHVTLTAEWANVRWGPVTKSASLRQSDGSFHHGVNGLSEADGDEVIAEVAAQLDRLTRLGFPISYLDEHMGVGSVGGIRTALSAFAKEKGLRSHYELTDAGRLSALPHWPGPGEHPGTELADALSSVDAGSYYLVGHPVFKSEEMELLHKPGSAPGHEMTPRNRQRRMFADIEIVDYCENRGIDLIRYRDV